VLVKGLRLENVFCLDLKTESVSLPMNLSRPKTLLAKVDNFFAKI